MAANAGSQLISTTEYTLFDGRANAVGVWIDPNSAANNVLVNVSNLHASTEYAVLTPGFPSVPFNVTGGRVIIKAKAASATETVYWSALA
jgi:hypothetical protein